MRRRDVRNLIRRIGCGSMAARPAVDAYGLRSSSTAALPQSVQGLERRDERALAARGHRVFAIMQPDIAWDARARARSRSSSPPRIATGTRTANPEERARGLRCGCDAQGPRSTWSTCIRRTCSRLRKARAPGLQSAARDPRSQREDGDRAIPGVHRTDPRLARCRSRRRLIDAHRDTIAKPLDGMGGTSVFRVRADDPNCNVIVETVAAGSADDDGAAVHPRDRRR